MKFVPIEVDKIEVVFSIDAAFAVNPYLPSHHRIILMLRDSDNGSVKYLHYSSTATKWVW